MCNFLDRDMLPGSSLLCMEQQGQPQLDHESLASLLILLFVEANKICTLRFHRVIRNLCYHIPTRDWIIRTILSIIERSNIQPKQNEQQQTISNRPHWLNIRLDAALGNRNNIFIIKKKCHSVDEQMEVDDSSDEITNALINEFSIAIHPQAAQVVCRHALDLLIALAKNFPANFLPIKKKTTNNTKPTIDENQPSTSSSARESSQLDTSTDFWDILLRLEMRSRSRKGAKKSSFGRDNSTNIIRSEDFTDIEVNSFSESPFGQLISMLSFNIILKSTLLTDKLLRLLAFISIGLPDAVLASTNQPVATNAIEASTEITANNAQTNNETETPETNAGNDSTTVSATAPSGSENQTQNTATTETSTAPTLTSTSTSTAPTSARSSKPAPIELDERCLPESQDSLRLAIEVLTSKSCSEEGLEDATSLLLNLSQCSNVTRTFILNLLIDGAKYLAGIVQGQINDLIIDLRQLNQKNRSELNPSSSQTNVVHEIQTENVYQPSTSSSSYVSKTTPATASGSKGILKDRFTKETVVITSTSKQKARCELQLPSMVPLISKTASQSFFLRILKVVIQIRESAKDSLAKETATIQQQQTAATATAATATTASSSNDAPSSSSATASTSTPTQEPPKRIVLNSIELHPLSETLLLDHLWNTLSDCLVELEENADHHAVLVLQPAVEAFFLVHASNQSNSSKSSNETDTRSQNQATANPTGDNAVNPPTNEPAESMQTDEPSSNAENNAAINADSEMAPVSPISLFDRYALNLI